MIFNGRISNTGIYVKPPSKVIKTIVISSINGTRTLFTFSIPFMPFFTVKVQKISVEIDTSGILKKNEQRLEKTSSAAESIPPSITRLPAKIKISETFFSAPFSKSLFVNKKYNAGKTSKKEHSAETARSPVKKTPRFPFPKYIPRL